MQQNPAKYTIFRKLSHIQMFPHSIIIVRFYI